MNRPLATFTLTASRDAEGFEFNSTSDGFTAFEILGLLEYKRDDIIRQMRDEIKPVKVVRTLIVDKE